MPAARSRRRARARARARGRSLAPLPVPVAPPSSSSSSIVAGKVLRGPVPGARARGRRRPEEAKKSRSDRRPMPAGRHDKADLRCVPAARQLNRQGVGVGVEWRFPRDRIK